MPEQAEMMEWRGCEVVDQDGDKVGKLDEIYLDRETGKPEWAIVNTGLFGRRSSFVPLKEALREGDMIRVPYQKDQVKEAPNVDPDGEISPDEEQQVYAHYGLEYSQARSGSGLGESAGTSGGTGEREAGDGQQAGSGLRLQRIIREDVRVGAEGDVVERRTVEEESVHPEATEGD